MFPVAPRVSTARCHDVRATLESGLLRIRVLKAVADRRKVIRVGQ